MASVSVGSKFSGLGAEKYGADQEQDANSALLELDKGLRSTRVGEQCEAIVRFPRLFEKYPFPILINSSFLKLADVFRIGNNFLRLCVLRVTQQSEKHLDKILNVDEFLRRIFSVIHSNDPIARALTLRVLGSIACIISERKNTHHSIRTSLDSHDEVEMEAAIFAASCFAAQSRTFAVGICNKIAEMIQGLATPVEMKLKLIPIFQHMHHDAQTAAKVRQLCVEMLPSYPARGFVMVTLHTLSLLSAKTLIDIPQQVELLLHYLQQDPRRAIKLKVLSDLHLLTKKAPHMWAQHNLQVLCSFISITPYDNLKLRALTVLSVLAESSPLITKESSLMEVCLENCYHSNIAISTEASTVLTNLACQLSKGASGKVDETLLNQCVAAVESLLTVCVTETTEQHQLMLKKSLSCVSCLCKSFPVLASSLADTIYSLLDVAQGEMPLLLYQGLAAVGSTCPSGLEQLRFDLLDRLQEVSAMPQDKQQDFQVLLTSLVLMACPVPLPGHMSKTLIASLTSDPNHWTAFCVARQAARWGHHTVAVKLLQRLPSLVASEHLHFWLISLGEFCAGEEQLSHIHPDQPQHKGTVTLAQACGHYQKGTTALKASVTPTFPLEFQTQFTQLRAELLQAHANLLAACTTLQTCPPPAIATAMANVSGKEIQRTGRIGTQLQQCVAQFRMLSAKYGDLLQASFDADLTTLKSLTHLQQGCLLMAHVVDVLVLHNHQYISADVYNIQWDVPDFSRGESGGEALPPVFQDVLKMVQKTLGEAQGSAITHVQVSSVFKASCMLLREPLHFPRYFFQALQSTQIKLALSPSQRSVNDPVLVSTDTQLALKVEGVIQHGAKPGLFRAVNKVCLDVSSSSDTKIPQEQKVRVDNLNNELQELVEPHNDYFSAQFLLHFPFPGNHTVCAEASVIDTSGLSWKTGPKMTLLVRSFDPNAPQPPRHQQPPPPPPARSSASRF
ncbi:integrator complex subunit 7-like [Branchiostoma floridae x Branchiostoma japonicum]